MENWEIMFGQEDYRLCSVKGFEPYFFITTAKWENEHDDYAGDMIVVDETGTITMFPSRTREDRSSARKAFNHAVSSFTPIEQAEDFISCSMMEFEDHNHQYNEQASLDIYKRIADCFAGWCKENSRVGAIVPHLYQGMRLPHLHLMYQRAEGKHHEFQDYFADHFLQIMEETDDAP